MARGIARKPPLVLRPMGVDEKAVGHGQQYATLVYNLEEATVEWIGEGPEEGDTGRASSRAFTLEQRSAIEGWGSTCGTRSSPRSSEHVPGAEGKMVFDRFHIMKHANEGVDKVRKRENRELLEEGDPTLKGSKHLWLYREENLPEKHRDRFAELRAIHLKTGTGVCAEGGAGGALATTESPGWATKYLATMVPLGDALATGADEGSGADDPGPPGRSAELLHAPDHECGSRGTRTRRSRPSRRWPTGSATRSTFG